MYNSNQQFGQDELVRQHVPLIKRIAWHLISRLPPSVQLDDLVQVGMMGLLEAARHYDPSRGASFETYAGIRIRGAMLDEIRKTNWAPRSVHVKAREVAEVVRKIENEQGRDARSSEVAETLGISLDDYHRILQDTSTAHIFSFDDPDAIGDAANEITSESLDEPFAKLQKEHFKRSLAQSIAELPERERTVMSLHYDEDRKFNEIASLLGVSDARVCQIHGQAIIRLRARMRSWLSEGE